MTAAEDILDVNIRHQVYLQRYSAQVVRRIIKLLADVDLDIVNQLQRLDLTDISRGRLERMLENIREINRQAYLAVSKEVRGELRELAKYEAAFQARAITNGLPLALDVVTPAAPQLYAAVTSRPFEGRLLREWVSDLSTVSFKRLHGAIRMGIVEGTPTDALVRQIAGTARNGYNDGILSISRRSAEAMVRTAVNHTTNVAREQTYSENAELIKGVRWVSTLDGRTSAVCRARDGQVYEMGKGPRPPAHPNCRSTTTPVLKSWKELGINLKEAPEGTRASMDGQVPAATTYQDWLKKQPAGFQDETLGKTKGKLFRKGGLSLDRFVDKSGHEYTLDELRRREAGAFERISG